MLGRPNYPPRGVRRLVPADREFLYTDQVGHYRAPHTPARVVWAGLVGPVRGVLRFLFLFSFFILFYFLFSFSVSFFSLLFLFIFSDSKILRFF
jgi:hypothetical protein